jgi:hypothetical protein
LTKRLHGVFDPLAIGRGGSEVTIHGWVWDEAAKAGLEPSRVRVKLDGIVAFEGVANLSRPDIVKTWSMGSAPNALHGFQTSLNLELGAPTAAKRSVAVFGLRATDRDGSESEWQLDESPRCVCGESPCPC